MRSLLTHVATAAVAGLAVFFWVGPGVTGNDIIVDQQRLDQLADSFRQSWQRPPSEHELDALVDNYLRTEMAWRYSKGSDSADEDVTVRNRARELLENRARESAVVDPPTRDQLQDWLDENPDSFRVERTTSMRQVYFDVAGKGIGADAGARFMLGRLRNQDMPDDISAHGDPSPVPNDVSATTNNTLAGMFGNDFAVTIAALQAGEWHGPITSKHGIHLVYIRERGAGRPAELSEIEDRVYASWLNAKKAQAVEELYERLREDFDIRVLDQV